MSLQLTFLTMHSQDLKEVLAQKLPLYLGVVMGLSFLVLILVFRLILVPLVASMGFGLAFGVLVDAFIVRMTLTPAIMALLGDKAWWIPKWLDRLTPNMDVEGAALSEKIQHERESAADSGNS